MTNPNRQLGFWEHVEELRTVLVRSILIIACGIAFSLFFYDKIFTVLAQPLKIIESKNIQGKTYQKQSLSQERISNPGSEELVYVFGNRQMNPFFLSEGTRKVNHDTYLIPPGGYIDYNILQTSSKLMIFGPLDGFMTTLKVSFWIGLVFTSPLWMLLLVQFISPALKSDEKRLILPFFILSLLFLFLGFSFAFFLTIPLANQYLYAFNVEIGTNLWSFSQYLDYTMILLLGNGLAFQLAVVALFLVHLNIFTARALGSKRRHMTVGAFILGALLTPPDVLTQFMLAIPLILLYEMTILYARFRESGKVRVIN